VASFGPFLHPNPSALTISFSFSSSSPKWFASLLYPFGRVAPRTHAFVRAFREFPPPLLTFLKPEFQSPQSVFRSTLFIESAFSFPRVKLFPFVVSSISGRPGDEALFFSVLILVFLLPASVIFPLVSGFSFFPYGFRNTHRKALEPSLYFFP